MSMGQVHGRPLRYSINVTLDGSCDHRVMIVNEAMHRHAERTVAQADALIFGRAMYELMEAGWRQAPPPGTMPDWMAPFADIINAAKKYVVSSTLKHVDWNAELVRGDLEGFIRKLKSEPGHGLLVGGVTLPTALAEMGLIDEYEFVVHPRLAGHGPTLLSGLAKPIDLELVSRTELDAGIVAMSYVPKVKP